VRLINDNATLSAPCVNAKPITHSHFFECWSRMSSFYSYFLLKPQISYVWLFQQSGLFVRLENFLRAALEQAV
jgi:hypothetical protein